MENKDVQKFYQHLKQDIAATQLSEEFGGNREQIFTHIAITGLADAGETENASLAYDKRGIGTRNQHQINGYAISENYENLDLFITVFKDTDEVKTLLKSELETAQKRISNFFQKCISKDYVNEIEESSEIFQLATTLANYQEFKDNLIRVNAFIITDGSYEGEFPENETVEGYNFFYKIVDIEDLYKISEHARVPIEIDFDNVEGESFSIPCLTADRNNDKYKTIIAIMPGNCIAKLYERHGARLLEQNVRSFLQFTGKINRGIRDTIRNEPEMFLAFNNGIAATADKIELDESGQHIKKIGNLQIVNGGQTTASIFNTARKEKVDISRIYVQIKFSIIDDPEQYGEIVARISKYANTQNKVNDADFSANNPSLVAIEKLSRLILSPTTVASNIPTYWFFERARGQYNTLRNREGRTKATQLAFDKKYPKKQMFTKVELAKYINAYQEIYSGKVLVIGPHLVVRGNEKNYAQFIASNLPSDISQLDSAYFEDAVAKCILFKSADRRYGIRPNSIGELKQVVVPYTLSLLNILTDNKLDLYKIWNNQEISQKLSDFLYNLMVKVNDFIIRKYEGKNYIESAKKAECWEAVKGNDWDVKITSILDDLIDEKNPPKRKKMDNIDQEVINQNKEIIKSIPPAFWKEILEWGKDSERLDITRQTVASNIAYKIRQNKLFADEEIQKGIEIIDTVAKYNEELLTKSEEYIGKWVTLEKPKHSDEEKENLIFGLIRKMISFDNEKNILKQEETDFLHDVLNGVITYDLDTPFEVSKYLAKLQKKGFKMS